MDVNAENRYFATRPTRATIIVPCFRAEATLDRCLRSLLRQTIAGRLEILVVLNDASDRCPQIAHGLASVSGGRMRVVTEGTQGASSARNRGIELATGDVLLFLDADCSAREDWAERMLEQLDDPAVLIAGGSIAGDPRQRSVVARHCRRRSMLSQRQALGHANGPFVQTANLGVRRRDALVVGGFDPLLHSGEDADFCWRLLRGHDVGAVRYVPQAKVFHHHRESVGALFRQCKVYGWSHVALGRRYGSHWPTVLTRAGRDVLGAAGLPIRFVVGCCQALREHDLLPAADPVLTMVRAVGHRAGQIEALLGRRPAYAQPEPAPDAQAVAL